MAKLADARDLKSFPTHPHCSEQQDEAKRTEAKIPVTMRLPARYRRSSFVHTVASESTEKQNQVPPEVPPR